MVREKRAANMCGSNCNDCNEKGSKKSAFAIYLRGSVVPNDGAGAAVATGGGVRGAAEGAAGVIADEDFSGGETTTKTVNRRRKK